MDILCVWILHHVDCYALCCNIFIPRILCTLYYFRIPSVAVHDFGTSLHRHAMDYKRRFKHHHGYVDWNWRGRRKQNTAALMQGWCSVDLLIIKKIIWWNIFYIIFCLIWLYYFSLPYLFLLKEVHNALILLTRIINFNQIFIEQNLLHFLIPQIRYLLFYLFLILSIK